MPIDTTFYSQSALRVARQLLGARLVRIQPDGIRLSGRIVETEAYTGNDDRASHAVRYKRTSRNAVMWHAPGIAYIYRNYGIHWLLNVVVEPAETPAAVLIRALEPIEGLDRMALNRFERGKADWTNGPARLTQAMGITGDLNQIDMTRVESGLWIEPDLVVPDSEVRTGPRIGLGQTPEPWRSVAWRWWIGNSPYVSARGDKSTRRQTIK
jgi:DNA-3-methyladenine glycosylase